MNAIFTHFFDLDALWRARIVMGEGALGTLRLAAATLLLAPIAGMAIYAVQLLPVRGARCATEWFIDLMRAIPLLVFLVMSYYLVLPLAGLSVDAFSAAVFGIALKHGVYFAEIYRGAYQSVPRGQFDAARMIGLRGRKLLRLVVVPQMMVIMAPALTSQATLLLRDLPLAFVIGYFEILTSARAAQVFTRNSTPLMGAVLAYAVTLLLMQWVTGRVERMSRRRMEA
ncbi:hypothetical protein DLJ53_29470 [Acuticoccus sediminis]|uniref:ABC transmembrane type-1 domain-containing protein n=1 Tax=Acuticoccus sediminis TaxID=2184697 RepID=A0A8B2NHD0_9HYPH|nr:ABC transporter permease subunit [Acuticoccus sediminis]RAH97333.1 hypothetical protein DLJ53_29470 [Acuticoccus sediminis]